MLALWRARGNISSHGINAVVDDVKEHLLQLMRVTDNCGNMRLKFAMQPYVPDLHVIVAQQQRLLEHLDDIELLFVRLPLTCERKQVLDNTMRALTLLENFVHI